MPFRNYDYQLYVLFLYPLKLLIFLLLKQSDTSLTQYRHIEHLCEEVWCQNINFWQNDSFVNLAIPIK